MLTIRRVPTVISLHQDDSAEFGGPPSPPSVLGQPGTPIKPAGGAQSIAAACCGDAAEGAATKFPLFSFAVRESVPARRIRSFGSFGDLVEVPDIDSLSPPSDGSDSSGAEKRSVFDTVLLGLWDDRSEKGLFRYDVSTCKTKLVDGDYGFIAQLNEGRATKKRPTEFRVDLVCQEFDHSKFNFNKADQSEVLFAFMPETGERSRFRESADVGTCPSLLLINVSPIEYGHVLLVPRVTQCLPQRIRGDVLNLAVHMAVESQNPYFRVGYNSLGAYATINHLHFQAYYLAAPFPIERAPTVPLSRRLQKRSRVSIQRVTGFPVRALVYELGADVEDLTTDVAIACERLQEANIPFNLLIADRGARIFLIPNLFSERVAKGEVPEHIMATGINPAVFEISGHLLYKAKADYNDATQKLAWELLAQASLSEERFNEVVAMITA